MTPVRVTLVTAPHCELCEHAEDVLRRVALDYDIAVRVVADQSEEGVALLTEHFVAFPPGVLLEGRLFSYGRLSERKLRRELDSAGGKVRAG